MCVCAPACPDVTEQRQQQQEGCISTTNFLFFYFLLGFVVLVLGFFFLLLERGKTPSHISPEWPIPFSLQSLNFGIAITFVTVKQTKKQAKTKGTAYRNCLASQKGANHCFSQPDCNAWIVWKHSQGPIATSFFSSSFTISRFSKLVLIYIFLFFY